MTFLILHNGNSQNNGVMAMLTAFSEQLKASGHQEVRIEVDLFCRDRKKETERWRRVGIEVAPPMLLGRLLELGQIRYFSRLFQLYRLIIPFFLLGSRVGRWMPAVIRKKLFGGFEEADVCLAMPGEDFLSDNCPEWLKIYHYLLFRTARDLKLPYYAMAQTWGPFCSASSIAYCRKVLPKIDMIYCRDEASVEIVSRFTVGNVKRVGDLAFLLPMTEYGKLLETHPELKRLPAEFIGVSVSNLFASSIAGANPEIATADDFFAATAECLDRLVNKYGMPIVFFSHVVFPDTVDDDRRAAARVAGRMKTKPIVLQDEYLASEIKAAMHLSKVFIGCRMHALIGSFSSGVPIIALAYSPKTVAVIGEGISYPYVIDLRSGSLADYKKAVETHLEDILNNYETVKARVAAGTVHMREIAMRNFTDLPLTGK